MKILSTEINLGSASNVSNASVIRLFNSGDSNILVTRKDYSGTVVGSFIVPAGQVIYAEKYFTDTLEGSADVKATKTAYSSMMSFEGSSADPLPTYTHSVSASSVNEGGSFTTTITTTNVDDGTNLYWQLTGVVSGDFSSGALTGTASISSNSATFSHTVDEDNLTEGTETVTIKVYSDSGRTTQVGNTLTVQIADTSTAPPGYAKLSTNNSDTKDAYQPTLSNNDLTAQSSTPNTTNWNHGRSTLGFTTGKWYWEVTATGNAMIGVEPISENIDRQYFNAGTTAGLATRDGKVWFGGSTVINNPSNDWSDGDTIGVAFDADNGHMYIYVNGTLKYSYDSTMSSSVIKKPSYSVYDAGSGQQWTLSFNFGDGGFAQTPPNGYNAVSLANGAVEAGYAHSAHRYWRIQEGDHTNYQIHPRSARLGLNTTDSLNDITWLYTFDSDNCADSGTYQNWTSSTYDHGSPIAFTHYIISSVFNGSSHGMTGQQSDRAGTYYIEYSDDGSSWTTAWAGVAHNTSQDGTGAEAIWPSTGEDTSGNNICFCGHGIMQGSRFGPDNPNDGTDWGSKWSGGFDQSIDLAFDGYLRTGAFRARTGGNAVVITMSGVSITVNEYVKVYSENNYPSTVTATIDGVTYTSAHTGNQVHTHTFRQTGTLTQLTVVNNGSQGRTYLEGIVVDGYLLKNNSTTNGWNY